MKNPEHIPDEMVEAARAAANEVPLTQNLSDDALRAILATAWDEIWADGYTDGFQSQEGLEIQTEALQKGGWAPHMYVFMDGVTEDQAEEVFDKVADFAHENEPEGVSFLIGGVLAPGKRRFTPEGDN